MDTARLLNLLFVLDMSASMFGAPINAEREAYDFVRRTIAGMDGLTLRYTTLVYHTQPDVIALQTEQSQDISAIEPGGVSNLGLAWQYMLRFAESARIEGSLVWAFLFTDGGGTDDWQAAGTPLRDFDGTLHVFGIPCPPEADLRHLQPYLHDVLHLNRLDAQALSAQLLALLSTSDYTS